MKQWRNSAIPIASLAVVLILTLFLSPAFAEDSSRDEEKSKSTSTTEQKMTNTLPSVKVGKDPDGAVRPTTPSEENKLNAELKKTLSKYPPHSAKQHPDGSISLVIAPHNLGVAIATVGPDGTVNVQCSDADHDALKTTTHKHELPEE